jgi:hypothetical protein
MNDTPSTKRMAAERSARYLDEVLLQPDQVNDVALTAAESDSAREQDGLDHPHGDY